MMRPHPQPQVDFILLQMRQKRLHFHWQAAGWMLWFMILMTLTERRTAAAFALVQMAAPDQTTCLCRRCSFLSPLPLMIWADSCADGAGPFFPLCTHLVLHFLHPLSIWLCCSLTLCLLMRTHAFCSVVVVPHIYQRDAERQRIQSSRGGMRMRQFARPEGSGFNPGCFVARSDSSWESCAFRNPSEDLKNFVFCLLDMVNAVFLVAMGYAPL